MRGVIGRRELKKSLRTSDRSLAKSRAATLSAKAEQFYFRARVGMLTERELEVLSTELIAEFTGRIADHKNRRMDAMDWLFTEGGPLPPADLDVIEATLRTPKEPRDVASVSDWYSRRINALEGEISTELFSRETRLTARRIAEAKNLTIDLPPDAWFHEPGYKLPDRYDAEFDETIEGETLYDSDSTEWRKPAPIEFHRLCVAVVQSQIDSYKHELERINGKLNTDYQLNIAKRIEAAKPKPKLSEFWTYYRENQIISNKWTAGTTEKNDQHYARILKIIGDKELSSYCEEDAINLIKKLKDTVTRGRKLGIATINFSLNLSSTMFKEAMKNPNKWCCTFNPFAGMEIQDTRASNERKDLFTDEELAGLIRVLAKVRRNVHPARFWVPLLALYTGARENELCQIRTKDVKKHAYKDKNGKDRELVYINIVHDPDDLMSTKNKSNRTCPIHPELINLGFWKYVEKQVKQKKYRLFSDVKEYRGKWNKGIGKWFNRTAKEKFVVSELEGMKKTFHSIRHNFGDRMYRLKLSPREISILLFTLAHAENKATLHETYIQSYTPEEQLEILKRLKYDFDLSILKE